MRIEAIVEQARLIQSLFDRTFHHAIDVGTDHGYVAELLLKRGLCRTLIASDVAQGPLDNAMSTLRRYVEADKVKLLLSDGIRQIDVTDADFAVIAGMGGELITKIIEQSLEKALTIPFFILQAMTEQTEMREALSNHMTYLWDYYVTEGERHYQITVFTTIPTEHLANFAQYEAQLLPNTPHRILQENRIPYCEHLTSRLKKIEKIIGFIRDGRAKGSDQLVREQMEKADRIRRFLREAETAP